MSLITKVLSVFPTPAYLSMPAAGLDISDHSVKFVEFSKSRAHGRRLKRYGSVPIPHGVVEGGKVVDKKKLSVALAMLAQEYKIHFVRASLPEEEGYIFPSYVPGHLSHRDVRDVLRFKLEENVPLSPDNALIDFELVSNAPVVSGQQMVSVSAYPNSVAEEYVDLLKEAGLEPLSLEIEAQAIARAVVPKNFKGTTMVVDIGRKRSGIGIAHGQTVRFTATIDIGGDEVDAVLQNILPDASWEELTRVKDEQGMHYRDDATAVEAFASFAKRLATELDRYIVYWQTHKDIKGMDLPHQPIEKILLVGGNANTVGLPEYLENVLHLPASRGNVWENAFAFDTYIPDLSASESLGYAPAVGLALHEDQ
jgi:type IV pilus assembly protein PilM